MTEMFVCIYSSSYDRELIIVHIPSSNQILSLSKEDISELQTQLHLFGIPAKSIWNVARQTWQCIVHQLKLGKS